MSAVRSTWFTLLLVHLAMEAMFCDCGFFLDNFFSMFVCVEVLRPSQPNGFMSKVASLPNYTFTGQV